MLDKLSGTFAPRPSSGPHKLRECLPLILLIRNRLKYALTKREVTNIVMQRLIKVDNKVRTDSNYPTGFMGKHNACAARGMRGAERAGGERISQCARFPPAAHSSLRARSFRRGFEMY